MQQQPDVSELWIKHQRRNNKTTSSWACLYCFDRKIFFTEEDLWNHAQSDHGDKLPREKEALGKFRKSFEADSAQKRPAKDDPQTRKPNFNEISRAQPDYPSMHSKRPLSTHAPTRSISGLQALNLESTPRPNEDIIMDDAAMDSQSPVTHDQPRKRAAIGEGVSAGSASPSIRARDSESPPPRRSKARPTSAPYGSASEGTISQIDVRQSHNNAEAQLRPHTIGKKLWNPDQSTPIARASFDPSNIASAHTQKTRAQGLPPKSRKPFQAPGQGVISSRPPPTSAQTPVPSAILGSKAMSQSPSKDDGYDIILQPETRPISQEQLVAEVKGIYAGLVMVEAKCIEVDNKQATLAQADPGAQPKLNNEQWQALIALHRTLLHEHHDFFLASQHPSASPALRRLASKYAMPARMWRHGIHSFLELLRHRLPASLDHMLAFIYLAYSMMALLYETVPAFEDTWIECLGDLGRYRMAIEDDDIRDREVWTGVARHWYSKASDKAPTTGRLYHHLAILARPNALQQLFYYAKSLCVVVPFTSARESILTLFEPVLNAEQGQGLHRLPPLDTAFVKAHGLLFTNKEMERFDPAVQEFLRLLDNQIGRVTRKFMEQGYYIAVSNSVSMLGFASRDNVLMKAMAATNNKNDADTQMADISVEDTSKSIKSFENAQRLSNATLEIILQRIGDPNVLPFIHVTLVFMFHMSQFPGAMNILGAAFPWGSLCVMLNTLLASSGTHSRIENDKFPLPAKDDLRPFPEDFAMRGLLWTEKYYPDQWFSNDKIDDEEKYLELPSMTAERKERILWLACQLASSHKWLCYSWRRRQFYLPEQESRLEAMLELESGSNQVCASTGEAPEQGDIPMASRHATWASKSTLSMRGTWPPEAGETDDLSETEDEPPPVPVDIAEGNGP